MRSWVGDGPASSDIEALYLQYGNWDTTISTLLNRQLALMIANPTSISVPGLSLSWSGNLPALQAHIQKFNSQGSGLDGTASGTSGFSIGVIRRVDRGR